MFNELIHILVKSIVHMNVFKSRRSSSVLESSLLQLALVEPQVQIPKRSFKFCLDGKLYSVTVGHWDPKIDDPFFGNSVAKKYQDDTS